MKQNSWELRIREAGIHSENLFKKPYTFRRTCEGRVKTQRKPLVRAEEAEAAPGTALKPPLKTIA